MNKVILIGHLCADPDVRYSQGENSMAVARYCLHFCGASGKILLYPLYLPQNCKKFEVRGEIYAGE